ncbi:hypothetical protein PENSPDRAFT_647248 [Peniophora sp. CONT]|nr:hypothetical protein PENSPDRAFT_647248 [Peniophora sp. CONT]
MILWVTWCLRCSARSTVLREPRNRMLTPFVQFYKFLQRSHAIQPQKLHAYASRDS